MDEWNPLARALRREQQIGGTRLSEPSHERNPYRSRSPSPRSRSSRGLLDRVPNDFNQDPYRDPLVPYPRVDPYYGRKEQRSPPLYSPNQRPFLPDRDPPRMPDRPPLLEDYYAFRPALLPTGPGPVHPGYPPTRRREPSPPPEPTSDYKPFPLLSAPSRNQAEGPLFSHPERKRALFDEVVPPPRRDDTLDSDRSGQRKLFQDAIRSALLPNMETVHPGILPEPLRRDPVSVPRTVDDFAQSEAKRLREDTAPETRGLSERVLPKSSLGWEQETEDRYRRDVKVSGSAAESVPEERSFLAMQQGVRKEDGERKPNGFGLSQKDRKAEKPAGPSETIRPVRDVAPVVSKPPVEGPVRPEAVFPSVKPLFPSVMQTRVGLEKGWDDTYPVLDTKTDRAAPVPTKTPPSRKPEAPMQPSLPAAPLFPMVQLEKAALLHYPSDERVLHMDSCPKGLANPLLQQSPLPLSRPGMPNPLLETPRAPLLSTYNRSESTQYPPRVEDLRQRDLQRFENRADRVMDTRDIRDGRSGDDWYRNRENYDDGHQRSYDDGHQRRDIRYGYVEERPRPPDNYDGYRADPSTAYQHVDRYVEQTRPSAPRPPVYHQETLPIQDPNLREFYEQLAARSSSFSGDIFTVNEESHSGGYQNGSRRNVGTALQELTDSSDTQQETGSRTDNEPSGGSSTVNKLLLNLIAALAEESGNQRQNSQGSADDIPVCEMEDAFTPDVDSQTPRWVEGFSGPLSPPSKTPVTPTHSCYVCNMDFGNSEEFTRHIKSSGHAQAYGSSRPAVAETSNFRPVGGRYYY